MGVTAAEVNELRKKTGAGLMDCKKALTESNGDLEAAIDLLRKKGQKVSELRAGKAANEGLVIAKTTADNKAGVAVNLSCETDFVAKNEDFSGLAELAAEIALKEQPESLEALLAIEYEGLSLQQRVIDLVAKINEKIELSKYEKLSGETVVAYNHSGNRMGVLVALNKNSNDNVASVGRDVAMQVAAMNPVAVDQNSVPKEIADKEFEIGKEQALAEGKPEAMVDKIATGRLQKYYKENTLLAQPFVKDGSKTVEQVLKSVDGGLTVTAFKRVTLEN